MRNLCKMKKELGQRERERERKEKTKSEKVSNDGTKRNIIKI